MICVACRMGGQFNAVNNVKAAANWHSECDDKCDCAHKTGKWLDASG